jgi:hypothetical protein
VDGRPRAAWLAGVREPFFAWVSFADPHHPFDPPAPWCDRYDPADMLEVLPRRILGSLIASRRSTACGRRLPGNSARVGEPAGRYLRTERCAILAAYYGMASQIDHAVGASSPRWKPAVSAIGRSSSSPPTTATTSATTR